MPRADLAKLIADNLAELPGPDGTHKLPMFSTVGQSPEAIKQIEKRNARIGESIARLIEEHGGYTVTHPNDPKASDQPGGKVVKAHCAHCACKVLQLVVDDQMNAQLHRVALEAMGHPHDCWS